VDSPFWTESPRAWSVAPAATSMMPKLAAAAGSRLIAVEGPPTSVTFPVICGSAATTPAGVVKLYVQFGVRRMVAAFSPFAVVTAARSALDAHCTLITGGV
jgi:hypothetical protein